MTLKRNCTSAAGTITAGNKGTRIDTNWARVGMMFQGSQAALLGLSRGSEGSNSLREILLPQWQDQDDKRRTRLAWRGNLLQKRIRLAFGPDFGGRSMSGQHRHIVAKRK